MAQTEDKFRKQLEVVKLKLDEIVEILASGNTEDISGTYEQIGESIVFGKIKVYDRRLHDGDG